MLFWKCKSKNNYFESIAFPRNEAELKDLRSKASTSSDIQTNSDIIFKNITWGISKKDITKKLGKPIHSIHNNYLNSQHTILFYKSQRSLYKSSLQFHFLNDQLIYISRNYKYIRKEYLNKILIHILSDLQIDLTISTPKDMVIKDKNNNTLIINTHFGIQAEYISGIYPSILQNIQ